MKTLAYAAMAATVAGCRGFLGQTVGSGVRGSEARDLGSFSAVEIAGSFDVDVQHGDKPSVLVEADDNLLKLIETKVVDDRLIVGTTSSIRTKWGSKIHIVTPSLDSVSLSGSGSVRGEGIQAKEFSAKMTGSGEMLFKGHADSFVVEVAGSGSANFEGLAVKHTTAEIAGSGDISLNASERIDASIAGSGQITYLGKPIVNQRVAGSGSIRQK